MLLGYDQRMNKRPMCPCGAEQVGVEVPAWLAVGRDLIPSRLPPPGQRAFIGLDCALGMVNRYEAGATWERDWARAFLESYRLIDPPVLA